MERNYKLLTAQHIDDAIKLLVESFYDDSYFQTFYDADSRADILSNMFRFGISFCLNNGFIYGCFEDERLIAVSLWFNYNQSKKDCTNDLKQIFAHPDFPDDDSHNFLHIIDKYIEEHSEYLYLLLIAVDKNYRRNGIAANIMNIVKRKYHNYNIITDVSNPYLFEYLISKQGFEEIDICNQCHLLHYKIVR